MAKPPYVSDQYAPFHTKVINATVRDATHVLDGQRWPRSFGQFFRFLSGTLGGHAAVFIAGSIAK